MTKRLIVTFKIKPLVFNIDPTKINPTKKSKKKSKKKK